jgi:hypothetical protein
MSYVVPLLCERMVLFHRIPIDVGGDGLLFRSAVVTAADLPPPPLILYMLAVNVCSMFMVHFG